MTKQKTILVPVEDIEKLPKLEVKRLWDCNWYDGPLSGACEVNGSLCYFTYANEYMGVPCTKFWECEDRMDAELDGEIPEMPEEWWEEEFCPKDQTDCYVEAPFRYYLVYSLDEETSLEFQRQHAVFQKYVGGRFDYTGSEVVEQDLCPEKYYEQKATWDDLALTNEDRVIGYFTL